MSAALLDHLWQSTVFAGFAWLTTLLLRRNAARLRHTVWLVASIKFLLPLSVLAWLGQSWRPLLGTGSAKALEPLITSNASSWVFTPGHMITSEPGVYWLGVVSGVWLIGFLALGTRWFLRWRTVQRLLRGADVTTIEAPVPVLVSPGLREPGVVGVFRPTLLLPAGIEARLDATQLKAILAHELCHVRRRDNLTASIHMLVEAVFWFHPLVWWIGARLIEERERACDEAVVRSGADPRHYAEGILEVCRSYAASDLACVSGVSGADLKTRLEGIMKTDDVKKLSGGKKFALAAVACSALAAPLLVGMASGARAESPAAEQGAKTAVKIAMLPGKRVKLHYDNVDVRALIRAMGEAGGVNILVSDKVSGNVTLNLAEMPWDQALNIILGSQGLEMRSKDGLVFIDAAPVTSQAGR